MALTSREPRARAARSIPLRELTLRAELLEKAVRKAGLASPAEVDAMRPGGVDNPDRGAHGTLDFCLWLHAEHQRAFRTAAQIATVDAAAAAVRPIYEQTVTDALRSVPERVAVSAAVTPLLVRSPRTWRVLRWTLRSLGQRAAAERWEAPRTVTVHPKSWDALWFLACQDFRVRWLARRIRDVQARLFADDPALLERLAAELSYRYGLIVWTAITPGPFLPFDPLDVPRLLPPAILALADDDRVRIHAAYVRVNALRLHALRTYYSLTNDPNDLPADGDPPSWNQFFATRQVEDGVKGEELFRDRDLPALVGAAVVAADAREKAVERARAEHERERKDADAKAPNGAAA